jgi:hypothetical protein
MCQWSHTVIPFTLSRYKRKEIGERATSYVGGNGDWAYRAANPKSNLIYQTSNPNHQTSLWIPNLDESNLESLFYSQLQNSGNPRCRLGLGLREKPTYTRFWWAFYKVLRNSTITITSIKLDKKCMKLASSPVEGVVHVSM